MQKVVFFFLIPLFLFTPLFLVAQTVSQVPGQLHDFENFPQAEIRSFGIGNFGFDGWMNSYNPRIKKKSIGQYLSISGNLTTGGSRDYTFAGKSFQSYRNQKILRPSLMYYADYQQIAFILSYHNTYLQKRKATHLFFDDPTTEIRILDTDEQDLSITKNTLFMGVSALFTPNLSMTLGISSSKFGYQWDTKVSDPADFYVGLFNDFQFYYGVNYDITQNIAIYGNANSQTAQTSLIERNPENDLTEWEELFSFANTDFQGHLGYGVQQKIRGFKLSLEMRHQFLGSVDTLNLSASSRSIWQNEVIAGINCKLGKGILIGLHWDHYLKLDNLKRIRLLDDEQVVFATSDNPATIVFSTQLTRKKYRLSAAVQYTTMAYSINESVYFKDKSSMASFTFGVHL